MKKCKDVFIWIILLSSLASCGRTAFDNKYHKVTQIINGNTIEVSSNVYIELIGVGNSQASKRYMEENVLGHQIRIRFDRKNKRSRIRLGSTLLAYVVTNRRISVNGQILKQRLSNLNKIGLFDSLEVYESYAYGETEKQNQAQGHSNPTIAQTEGINKKKTLAEIVSEIKPCVFMIITADEENNPISQGTGFFIERNGIAVSNHHVFEDGKNYFIKTHDGNFFQVDKILSDNIEYDLIIFQVEEFDTDFPYFDLDTSPQQQGENVFVLGNPRGLENTLTTGVISSLRSEKRTNDYIQISAAVSHGSSGSPLCNMKGEAIGVIVSKLTDCENCNFAIHMNIVKNELDKIIY